MKKLFISIVLLFLCGGCVTANYGKFSIASTKPVDFSKSYVKSEPVTGKDVEQIIIIFPTGGVHISDAVEDALNKANAVFLTDVEIKAKFWIVPFYARLWVEVTGEAWREANY